MKVVAVLAAVVMMAVLGIVAGVNRKALRWLALAIPLPMMKWPSFAVMLFSAEFYRGTCRGMEISLCYLLSFAMMVALTFRRVKGKFLPDWGSGKNSLFGRQHIKGLWEVTANFLTNRNAKLVSQTRCHVRFVDDAWNL